MNSDITVEQMIEELKKGGWKKWRKDIWKSPQGAMYYGPAGAWKAMKGITR